jgi:hypothetical protein
MVSEKVLSNVIPIVAIIALFIGPCLAFEEPTYHGIVLDAETKEPIEGVIVNVIYNMGEYGLPGYESSVGPIADLRETVTDKTGFFSLPKRIIFSRPNAGQDITQFLIYKPGYNSFPHSPSMPLLNLIDQERFFRLDIGSEQVMNVYHQDIKTSKLTKIKTGIVYLSKLKSTEERQQLHTNSGIRPVDDARFWRNQPLLRNALREEYKYLYGKYPDATEDLNKVREKATENKCLN